MMKKTFIFLCILFFGFYCFAETEGERLFRENLPEEAVVQLEKEIREHTNSLSAYNFLGLSYIQLGEYKKAVEVFGKGLETPGTKKKSLAFNQGNAYYALGDFSKACESYSLALKADPSYSVALLNRANSYVMANELEKSLADYEHYLEITINDAQKSSIEAIIAALKAELAKRIEEEERVKKEQELMRKEQERLARESKPVWEALGDDEQYNGTNEKPVEKPKPPVKENAWEEVNEDLNPKFDSQPKKEKQKTNTWQDLSDDDLRLMYDLDVLSQEEYEQRLLEKRKAEEARALKEKLDRQAREEAERQERLYYERRMQEMEEERLRLESERKQRLLETVENTLKSVDTTTMEGGAAGILQYDEESELD